jgi:sarcosine oxidase subunit beta
MGSDSHVVIIGGGIIGLSAAYHLGRRQQCRVTLIERGRLAHGSTRFGSGGLRAQFDSPEETRLSLRSRAIWRELERRHDVDLGFRRVGYLALATDAAAAAELERRTSFQEELGLDIRTVTGADLGRLAPGLRAEGVALARLTPGDGYAVPRDVARTLADLAADAGVTIREGTAAHAIATARGRVTGVTTDAGDVRCDAVVNAAGIWASSIGEMVGVTIPVTPYYHHQFVTEPLRWLTTTPPCIAELDDSLYARPDDGGLLFGIAGDGRPRAADDVDRELLPKLRRKLAHRWPAAAGAAIRRAWVGPYELSPDRRPFIGALDDPRGFIYANGFSGHGFMLSLAVGEAVAELAADDEARTSDISSFALDRRQPDSTHHSPTGAPAT